MDDLTGVDKRALDRIEELEEAKLKVDDDLVKLYARYKRLREAIQKWYDYGYNRGEAEKLLEGEHVES